KQRGVRLARLGGGALRPPRFGAADDVLAQGEGRFALEHAPALVGHDQAVAVVSVARDQLGRLQLAQDAAPVGRSPVLADAEGLELVVSVPRYGLRGLAGQNVGEVAEEEAARGAQDRRQSLLRLDPPIDQPNRAFADVAMAARTRLFAEHAEQRLAPA